MNVSEHIDKTTLDISEVMFMNVSEHIDKTTLDILR